MTKARSQFACLLLLATVALAAPAQEPESIETEAEEQQEGERSFLERPIGDNWVLSPVILPIVAPELGVALAIGGIATFSTEPENEKLPRSTLGLFLVPSTRGSIGADADLEGFLADDNRRVELKFEYDDGPSDYWGVGYDIAREIGESDDDVTEFERRAFELPVVLNFRVGKSLFAGLNVDYIDMQVDERSPTQEASPDFLTYGDEITLAGAGGQITFDTRDVTLNPYSGWYLNAKATFYRDGLGSDEEFEIYEVDYRGFYQIGRPGRTLAWQLYGQLAQGEVPWIRKPKVGSSSDLRGYTDGRFIDDAAAWALVEYRHMTDSELWKLGRNGFVAWAGVGFIGEDFGDFGGHHLPNVGVGYRLEVQERTNLRLDVGWGYDEVGVYLNFNEAF